MYFQVVKPNFKYCMDYEFVNIQFYIIILWNTIKINHCR